MSFFIDFAPLLSARITVSPMNKNESTITTNASDEQNSPRTMPKRTDYKQPLLGEVISESKSAKEEYAHPKTTFMKGESLCIPPSNTPTDNSESKHIEICNGVWIEYHNESVGWTCELALFGIESTISLNTQNVVVARMRAGWLATEVQLSGQRVLTEMNRNNIFHQ